MKIWTTVMGQRLDSADNTRSMLICAELLRRGHQVVMWTSAYDHIRKEWRREWLENRERGFWMKGDLEVRFMRGCGYRENVSLKRFADHWLAARDFTRQAGEAAQPDLIIASLPDHLTASAVVSYGKSRGIPVVVDVRDKWPDVFADYVTSPGLAALVKLGLSWESRRAARAIGRADAVVAMMNSMMNWGLKKAGRAPTWRERVFYLTTSPKNFDVPLPEIPAQSAVRGAVAQMAGRVVFSFVGTFNRTQHPLLILDAMDYLASIGKNDPSRFALVIAGDGVDAELVRQRAQKHENVSYVGWVDSEEMSYLLAHSSVGILTMNFPSPAFNNKSFSYLASGIPIINGATGDLAQLIEEEGAGINVPAGDPRAMADAMLALAVGDDTLAQMTANVRDLFNRRFDRDKNYADYADHVEAVLAERRGTTPR